MYLISLIELKHFMSKKVFRIISSPRGENSISRKLGKAILEKIEAKYPDSSVKELDLVKNNYPHLQEAQINLFFTPAENLTAEQAETLQNSTGAIAGLKEADIVVIDAPMYNYTITSYLKAFIDHVVRYGVTFMPTEHGVEGLVKGKKVYIAVSSGFIYSEGPFQKFDLLTPYLSTMLGWIGMTDLTFYRAEGMNVPVVQDKALQNAIDGIIIE
jgi:FMN-dependent NADH-azoreductase